MSAPPESVAGVDIGPWWRREPWPLVPRWWYRAENENNKSDWGFSWLFLSAWTGIALNLGVIVELDGQGVRIQVHVPYLHVRLMPVIFPYRWHQWGWRVKR